MQWLKTAVLTVSLILGTVKGFPGRIPDSVKTAEARQTVQAENVYEGDLFERKALKNERGSERFRKGTKEELPIWPTHEIPFGITTSAYELQIELFLAMEEIESKTCIRFVPKPTEKNFVEIHVGRSGCYSDYGFYSNLQRHRLSISESCKSKGEILHLLGHILGLLHTHNHWDAMNYIILHPDNLSQDYRSAFDSWRRNVKLEEHNKFDLQSVMLFGGYQFSQNKEPTITNRRNGKALAKLKDKTRLSDLDAKLLNYLYKCTSK